MADTHVGTRSSRPELEGVSIVVVGRLNPAIFQPLWFARHNLVREEEAQEAKLEIIHREVTVFSTEWFSLQVTDDKYQVATQDPTMYRPLRDLALGTFKILEHTPITAFGFNINQHFPMESQDEWHALGDHYAPKDSWLRVLKNPGLRSLVIEGTREDCQATRMQIRLQPSNRVRFGVFVHVNEHYDIAGEEDSIPTNGIQSFLKIAASSWDGFLSYGDNVAQCLLSEYEK